jgi:hypothetical protein
MRSDVRMFLISESCNRMANIGSDRYQISCSFPWGYLKETSISPHLSPLRVVMQVRVSALAASGEV